MLNSKFSIIYCTRNRDFSKNNLSTVATAYNMITRRFILNSQWSGDEITPSLIPLYLIIRFKPYEGYLEISISQALNVKIKRKTEILPLRAEIVVR